MKEQSKGKKQKKEWNTGVDVHRHRNKNILWPIWMHTWSNTSARAHTHVIVCCFSRKQCLQNSLMFGHQAQRSVSDVIRWRAITVAIMRQHSGCPVGVNRSRQQSSWQWQWRELVILTLLFQGWMQRPVENKRLLDGGSAVPRLTGRSALLCPSQLPTGASHHVFTRQNRCSHTSTHKRVCLYFYPVNPPKRLPTLITKTIYDVTMTVNCLIQWKFLSPCLRLHLSIDAWLLFCPSLIKLFFWSL